MQIGYVGSLRRLQLGLPVGSMRFDLQGLRCVWSVVYVLGVMKSLDVQIGKVRWFDIVILTEVPPLN